MPKGTKNKKEILESSLRQIEDLVAGEGNIAVRTDFLRSLRETRETIYQEMEGVERLSTSKLFMRPEEKVHLRDSLALLRHTLLSLDTAIYTMEENLKIETGDISQTDTPLETE